MFPNKAEIRYSMSEEHIPHIMIDTDDQSISTFPPDSTPIYPNDDTLRQEMRRISKQYGIERTGKIINKVEQRHIDFSRQIRVLFMNELVSKLKSLDQIM